MQEQVLGKALRYRDRSNPRRSEEGTGEGEDRTAGLSVSMVLLRGSWKRSGIMVTFSELRSGRRVLMGSRSRGRKLRRGLGIFHLIAGL